MSTYRIDTEPSVFAGGDAESLREKGSVFVEVGTECETDAFAKSGALRNLGGFLSGSFRPVVNFAHTRKVPTPARNSFEKREHPVLVGGWPIKVTSLWSERKKEGFEEAFPFSCLNIFHHHPPSF